MKKTLAMLLAVIMVVGLFAACGNTEDKNTEKETTEAVPETTEAVVDATSGATVEENTEEEIIEEVTEPVAAESNASTVILENIWAQVGEDNQFFVVGGNMENYVDGAPGNYNMEYKENLPFNLLVPEAELANIDEAGFMQHAMNANNFTAGVVHYTGDVATFAAAMQAAIQGNQWMCGFPETLIIAAIDSEYVLVSFGVNDAMDLFVPAVSAAYANAEILYNEAIAG